MALVLLAGCSGNPDTPVENTGATDAPLVAPAKDVMQDMTLDLWPSTDTPGDNVKPLLSIRAERVMGMGDDSQELTFEGAEAVVPATGPNARELQFSAKLGSFVQGVRANLRDGVVARIDDMTITLEEISWDIVAGDGSAPGTGVASSDKPLHIMSPTQDLEAQGLRLYLATETLELRDVTGFITFTGDTP